MREKVALVCTECESRNYNATKKKGDGVRLQVMKYCPKCGKHTLHKEGK
ncbi:MAG: 50S ribosomal protein L33 [Bacilli bacterium]|jgi:large subunit ribosomal protein L33|nr:50S ribosomal protein L33 [Bacilli bacterium]